MVVSFPNVCANPERMGVTTTKRPPVRCVNTGWFQGPNRLIGVD